MFYKGYILTNANDCDDIYDIIYDIIYDVIYDVICLLFNKPNEVIYKWKMLKGWCTAETVISLRSLTYVSRPERRFTDVEICQTPWVRFKY